jgi:pSer/pThr/pTyr-binding forkhead associated (FHA) protein
METQVITLPTNNDMVEVDRGAVLAILHWKHHEFKIYGGDNIVGRGKHCDVIIDHISMSDTHAEIICEDGHIYIKDIRSTNGTFIENPPCSNNFVRLVKGKRSELCNGNSIRFGIIQCVIKICNKFHLETQNVDDYDISDSEDEKTSSRKGKDTNQGSSQETVNYENEDDGEVYVLRRTIDIPKTKDIHPADSPTQIVDEPDTTTTAAPVAHQKPLAFTIIKNISSDLDSYDSDDSQEIVNQLPVNINPNVLQIIFGDKGVSSNHITSVDASPLPFNPIELSPQTKSPTKSSVTDTNMNVSISNSIISSPNNNIGMKHPSTVDHILSGTDSSPIQKKTQSSELQFFSINAPPDFSVSSPIKTSNMHTILDTSEVTITDTSPIPYISPANETVTGSRVDSMAYSGDTLNDITLADASSKSGNDANFYQSISKDLPVLHRDDTNNTINQQSHKSENETVTSLPSSHQLSVHGKSNELINVNNSININMINRSDEKTIVDNEIMQIDANNDLSVSPPVINEVKKRGRKGVVNETASKIGKSKDLKQNEITSVAVTSEGNNVDVKSDVTDSKPKAKRGRKDTAIPADNETSVEVKTSTDSSESKKTAPSKRNRNVVIEGDESKNPVDTSVSDTAGSAAAVETAEPIASTAKKRKVKSDAAPVDLSSATKLNDASIRILFTGIEVDKDLQKYVDKIGASIVTSPTTATHVITLPMLKRTPKLMIALNSGAKYVVHLKWLEDSAKAGQPIDIDLNSARGRSYIVVDKAKEKLWGFSMISTLQTISQGMCCGNVFANYLFFITKGVCESVAPPSVEMRAIIESGGGQWLDSINQLKSNSGLKSENLLVISEQSVAKRELNKTVLTAAKNGAGKGVYTIELIFLACLKQRIDLDSSILDTFAF